MTDGPRSKAMALQRQQRRNRAALVGAFAVVLVAVVSGVLSTPVFGQATGAWVATPMAQPNGMTVRMPRNRPVSRWSKLSLTVDSRWANNYGYRPVEVSVSSPTSVASDHLITVRLHTGQRGSLGVEQDFTLPAGATSATTTIAVPQYQTAMQFCWWEVWIDGIKDRDLSLDKRNAVGGVWSGATSGVSFLAVGPASQHGSLVAPNSLEFEVLSLTANKFPQRWIEYTCLDAVSLSLSELQNLSQNNPAAFEAVKRWVRAGGQLWVGDVGARFERLSAVTKLLELRNAVASDIGDIATDMPVLAADASPDSGWRPARYRGRNSDGQVVTFLDLRTNTSRTERDPDVIARLQNDPNLVITSQQIEATNEDAERARRRWSADSGRWFIEQRLGIGSVRAFREASEVSLFQRRGPAPNPSVAANEDTSEGMPRSLSMALRSRTLHWDMRHGTAPDSANPEFANLLVPGVGLAPVTEFRVLITLFVLLIGPVNYWLLKRWRRLHLLVLTVPLAAALMTAALFAYAVVSDGFDTTVRTRSFTTIDQRTGEAACWAQISYYSGLAPRQGLTMPADVAMYPVVPAWNTSSIDANIGVARDMVWKANEARLTRGWLRSRRPTQYLTVRARKTPHRLELASGGGKLRATNKLGTRVEFVVVVDGNGKLMAGEKLDDGSISFLQPIERTEAIRRLRKIVLDNEPRAPEALIDPDSQFALIEQRRQRQIYGRSGGQYSQASLASNLVNDAVADLAGTAGGPALDLPPRSYIAVTATGPEVEVGMSGAKEEASFHVVVGQW